MQIPFQTQSFAKLNIFLRITGREDDMHLIESLFVYIDLCDHITIFPSENNSLEITGPYKQILLDDLKSSGAVFEQSIFAKTLKVFNETFNINGCFKIKLEKHIPIGAGLGGGSSNAASFLKFLLRFYQINISQEHQYKLAAKIGADCPFFMQDSARFIYGVGDKIGPKVKIKPCRINLFYDNIKANTVEVFKTYKTSNVEFSNKLTKQEISILANKLHKKADLIKLSESYGNDLEVAFQSLSGVMQHNDSLKGLYLSGSGSCHYSFFHKKKYMTKAISCVMII